MLIAVASKSGTEVDQHFGHAERFLIFDCAAGKPQLVREVAVEKYCSYDPNHAFRKPQFQAIVESLAGCSAVVTAMIGDYPRQELEKAGMRHLAAEGPIEQAVRAAHHLVCGCGCRCEGQKKC
ncbi:MAG: dinitrogenase iron-molybdenum cofactor biosynthesis protein [Deltaproteobacteria bacterium]|nr:MAG: dinitrogenase iron-molybdenum cofactor biosynthesis protein [Deltaproteobacteria bacterium]